eukprot:TRINITY_DN4894_c0_g1_i2.p3 TRINITY_DN4894_c0_g1~~TRINITY_DN4894_c0_g1_i2.p3  ORF type:complete len:151 (+),score=35.36 TRINITY_DN4894_c0_g1_i2:655-1107(+)
MKKEQCAFSGWVVHPGHGRRYVPTNVQPTKPVFVFATNRCRVFFLRKKNPRNLRWTVLYRRLHKKSAELKEVKKAQRTKVQRVWRSYGSLDKDKWQQMRTGGAKPKKTVTATARAAAVKEVEARKAKQTKKPQTQTRAPPPAKNVAKSGR